MEDTEEGPLDIFEGSKLLISKSERQDLVNLAHEDPNSASQMIANVRKLWYWLVTIDQLMHIFLYLQNMSGESEIKI